MSKIEKPANIYTCECGQTHDLDDLMKRRNLYGAAGPSKCAGPYVSSGHVSCLKEIPLPNTGPKPVWWIKESDGSWCNLSKSFTNAYDPKWLAPEPGYHFGPRPPCEEGKHEPSAYNRRCRICFMDDSSPGFSYKIMDLDVGAGSDGKAELGSSSTTKGSAPSKETHSIGSVGADRIVRAANQPLHQDPRRFRGHLKGCHAWGWENYDRCSCNRAFEKVIQPNGDLNDIERRYCMLKNNDNATNVVIKPFTPRLSDWDL